MPGVEVLRESVGASPLDASRTQRRQESRCISGTQPSGKLGKAKDPVGVGGPTLRLKSCFS